MKKKSILCLFLFIITYWASDQIGIGTTSPDDSAQLEIVSTSQGVLIPRMTQAQRLLIAGSARGLLVYQTDASEGFWFFDGSVWRELITSGWSTIGDAGTDSSINYVGTSDSNDLVIVADDNEVMRIEDSQEIGIGIINPEELLHLQGTGPLLRIEDGNEAVGRVLVSNAAGEATWSDYPAGGGGGTGTDNDWAFFPSGTTPDINANLGRNGPAIIGRTTEVIAGVNLQQLLVDDLSNSTRLAIGDVEFIQEGNDRLNFSHRVLPIDHITNGTPQGGVSARRWRRLFATNGVVQTSDESLKDEIYELPYGVKDIMKLKPVSYYWKKELYSDFEIPDDKKEKMYGFIAQDLKKVIPEVVRTYGYVNKNENEPDVYVREEFDRMGVNYQEIIPLLIKAEQEQQERIKKLILENKALKNSLTNYKNSKE